MALTLRAPPWLGSHPDLRNLVVKPAEVVDSGAGWKKTRRRRNKLMVCATGIELEDIKRWFQGQRSKRKELIALEAGKSTPLSSRDGRQRVNFDLNLAVVLAGFAFEAYNTPSKDSGVHETDGNGCDAIFLNESFLRELYRGQLSVKLLRAENLPGLDFWGTSDPYVVVRVGESVQRSRTAWVSNDPVWDQTVMLNVVEPSEQTLEVAVWDANILTAHRRLGSSSVPLSRLCDGSVHELELDLEGPGGGGAIYLEVSYKNFSEIQLWRILQNWEIPFVSDLVRGASSSGILTSVLGKEGIRVQDFVGSAFRSLHIPLISATDDGAAKDTGLEKSVATVGTEAASENLTSNSFTAFSFDVIKNFKGLGLPQFSWSTLDTLKQLGFETQAQADTSYIREGLARPSHDGVVQANPSSASEQADLSSVSDFPSVVELKAALLDMLGHTEEVLGSWLMMASPFAKHKDDPTSEGEDTASISSKLEQTSEMLKRAEAAISLGKRKENPTLPEPENRDVAAAETSTGLNSELFKEADEAARDESSSPASHEETEKQGAAVHAALQTLKREQMTEMFRRAETAMEAWTILATALGRTSFVKSEFEKICFLENTNTDTQVAVWRDIRSKRLVVAFRGTEQTKWKDLATDLTFVPTGFIAADGAQECDKEILVHTGFLTAYESVRHRLLSIIKSSIGCQGDDDNWHIYATGHSLGGALATLLALDLSHTKMFKSGKVELTMYNFGSPRVGNKAFAKHYNEVIMDSWRIVNQRDIIPTVPRLMGYCHVAQPFYLSRLKSKDDEYTVDVIGEATPVGIVNEFLKGEKQLIQKLLKTEIAMLRAIRDGSALMQHMEDFYYISLLECVSSKCNLSELCAALSQLVSSTKEADRNTSKTTTKTA